MRLLPLTIAALAGAAIVTRIAIGTVTVTVAAAVVLKMMLAAPAPGVKTAVTVHETLIVSATAGAILVPVVLAARRRTKTASAETPARVRRCVAGTDVTVRRAHLL